MALVEKGTQPDALFKQSPSHTVVMSRTRPAVDAIRRMAALTAAGTQGRCTHESELRAPVATDLILAPAQQAVVNIVVTDTTPAELVGELADFMISQGTLSWLDQSWHALPYRSWDEAEGLQGQSRAFGAFTELAGWLSMTLEETADLLGIGRTTPFTWEREGREPQPRRARRLYQTHALVGALVGRLGVAETYRWLMAGDTPALDLIAAGRLSEAEDRAEPLIFGKPASSPAPLTVWREEEPDDVPPIQAIQAAGRRRIAASSRRRITR